MPRNCVFMTGVHISAIHITRGRPFMRGEADWKDSLATFLKGNQSGRYRYMYSFTTFIPALSIAMFINKMSVLLSLEARSKWRARDDSNVRPPPSEGGTLSS